VLYSDWKKDILTTAAGLLWILALFLLFCWAGGVPLL